MFSPSQLWQLYDEWKALTEKERSAILESNWKDVRRCQAAKEELQPKIVTITEALQNAKAGIGAAGDLDAAIRKHVNELIALEMENSSILQKCMAKVEEEKVELDGASSRLRKIHKSYGAAPAPVLSRYS